MKVVIPIGHFFGIIGEFFQSLTFLGVVRFVAVMWIFAIFPFIEWRKRGSTADDAFSSIWMATVGILLIVMGFLWK